MNFERRPVKHSSMLIYTIGRTYLLELFHAELQANRVRIADGEMSRRAYAQLMGLETEMRETGVVYTCPPGQHDDLGISCAMLAWAARHPHLDTWVRIVMPAAIRASAVQLSTGGLPVPKDRDECVSHSSAEVGS